MTQEEQLEDAREAIKSINSTLWTINELLDGYRTRLTALELQVERMDAVQEKMIARSMPLR